MVVVFNDDDDGSDNGGDNDGSADDVGGYGHASFV
jgi:hypothetical protein